MLSGGRRGPLTIHGPSVVSPTCCTTHLYPTPSRLRLPSLARARLLPWRNSPPPSQAAASFLPIALPGSPVHRCVSSALRRYTNKAPPPPTPTPPTHPRTPAAGSTLTETRSRDLDAVVPYLHTRPRGEGRGGSAARSEAGGRERGGSASGVVEIVFAAFVGSALDLDHFLAAGSLRLSRATGLPGRPWGHCVAALVVAVRREEARGWQRCCQISGGALRVCTLFVQSFFKRCGPGRRVVRNRDGVFLLRWALRQLVY